MCPAGHPSIEEYELKDAPERVEVHFAGTTCEPCPLRSRCPVKLDRRAGAYVLKADLVKVNIERAGGPTHRGARKRYDIRAGIEGTNSELKRAHGLGRLRVRGGRRVRLAVYLKACRQLSSGYRVWPNIKIISALVKLKVPMLVKSCGTGMVLAE